MAFEKFRTPFLMQTIPKILKCKIISGLATVHTDLLFFGDIAYAVEYHTRTERKPRNRIARRHPGKHQNGIQTAFDSGNNIRIHTIADHRHVGRMNARLVKT